MTPTTDQLKTMQAEFNLAWVPIWKQICKRNGTAAQKATYSFCHQVAWEAWYAAKQMQLTTNKVTAFKDGEDFRYDSCH